MNKENISRKLRDALAGNKQVVSNFISLFLVQGVNFIIPIVIIPYVVSMIGVEKFGVVSMIQVLTGYFIIIADYGFNLKGTRDIARKRENPEELSRYISLLLHVKIMLCIVCFLFLLLLLAVVPRFGRETTACLLAFPMVIGHTFNPVWFFQGIERMKYITCVNILGKVLLLGFTFWLVRSPEDYEKVLLSYGLSFLLSSGTGLWLMFSQYNIRFSLVAPRVILAELRSGFTFFLSSFSVNLYIHSNILILGFFTTDFITGIYSIIDKIIYAFRQILLVFFQATYPRVCRMLEETRAAMVHFQRQVFLPFIALVLLGSIVLVGLAPFVYGIMSNGGKDPEAIFLLRALAFVPFVIALNIPANQLLLAYDHKKEYTFVLISAAACCICINLALIPLIGMNGAGVAVIITECYVTAGFHFVLWKKERFALLASIIVPSKQKT